MAAWHQYSSNSLIIIVSAMMHMASLCHTFYKSLKHNWYIFDD